MKISELKDLLKKSYKSVISGIVIGVIGSIIATNIVDVYTDVRHPKYEIGDIVTFGHYEQDNDIDNGPESLEWYVIAKDNGKYLLLSKYVLDAHEYHSEAVPVSWEKSSLREWMNSDFISSAFSAKELKKISAVNNSNADNDVYDTVGGNTTLDKVFLLSANEAKQHLTSSIAFGICTPYADAQGAFSYTPGHIDENTEEVIKFLFEDGKEVVIGVSKETNWLLRSPGYNQEYVTRVFSSYYADSFSDVGVYIDYAGLGVGAHNAGIRPALWYES